MIPSTAHHALPANRNLFGIVLVLAASGCFALSPVLTVLAVDGHDVSPATVTALRFLLVFAALPFLWRRLAPQLGRRHIKPFLIMGLCYAVESFGYATAVTRIPVGLAVLIVYLFPLLVALIVALADRKPPGFMRWLSLFVAFAGVGLAVGPELGSLDGVGLLLAFCAALAAATAIWQGASLTAELGAFPVSAVSLMMAGVLYTPLYLAFGEPALPGSAAAWGLSLAAGALFFLALCLFYGAIHRIGAVKASLFANAEPAITALCALMLLSETPGPWQLPGTLLVIFALCLPERMPAFMDRLRPILR